MTRMSRTSGMATATGKLVVLSGPSGAGKTSVVHALKGHPAVEFSVSATTRAPRPGERDGIDYHFVDRRRFEEMRDRGELLEWAEYNGHLYGTPRAPMERAIAAGRIFLLEIEVEGTRQLRQNEVSGLYVFIVPPGIDELRRRLERRAQNSTDDIDRRLQIAARELQAGDLYDHVVVNEDLAATVAEVERLLGLPPVD